MSSPRCKAQPWTDSAPGTKPVRTEKVLLFFPPAPGQRMGQRLGWVSLGQRERVVGCWVGDWCHAGGSWKHWQGYGAGQEGCVAGWCGCVSGCRSPGISSRLDSCANSAGELIQGEVTVRKWKRLEAYQGVKPHHNIPPGQIRITLVQ